MMHVEQIDPALAEFIKVEANHQVGLFVKAFETEVGPPIATLAEKVTSMLADFERRISALERRAQ